MKKIFLNQNRSKQLKNHYISIVVISAIGLLFLSSLSIIAKPEETPEIKSTDIVRSVKDYNTSMRALGPKTYRAVGSPCCIFDEILAYGSHCYPWGDATCVENPCPSPTCFCGTPCD